jgi:translation initiation factor 1A
VEFLAKFNNHNNAFQNKRLRAPNSKDLEMYGKVIQLMGVNNIKIMCADGLERICRIPGKMFKHIWIKPNDVVIVKLWDFQPSKADVVWRYLGFQRNQLERKGELTKLYEFTHDDITPHNPYYNNRDSNYNRNRPVASVAKTDSTIKKTSGYASDISSDDV